MNKSSKIILALIFAALLAAGALYVWSVYQTKLSGQEVANYRNKELGMSFTIPAGWTVSTTSSPHSNVPTSQYTFHSPDYVVVGDRLLTGATISIVPLGDRATNPDEFIQQKLSEAEKCSNCENVQKINLDGVSAVRFQSPYDAPESNSFVVEFMHNTSEYRIVFGAASTSPEYAEAFEKFLASIRFLK